MGNFTSTAAAYQQLRPIEDKSLDNLLKVENLMASREGRRLRSKKMSADAAAKEEAALNKSLKDSGLSASLDAVITGVESTDEILFLGMGKAADERLKMQKQIESGDINPNAPEQAAKISNLNAWPKKLKSAFEIMTKNVARFREAYEKGEISEWDKKKLDKYSAFWGVVDPETGKTTPNFIILPDERGNPYAIGKTQDGERIILSINDINSGNIDLFDSRPTVDRDTEVSNYASKLGKSPTTTIQGPYRVTEQTFDDKRDEVIGATERKFGTFDNPSDFAKSVWTDYMKRDPESLDEAGMDEMKGNYLKDVRSQYDTQFKKTLDTTFESRQKRLQEEDKDVSKNFIELFTDDDGVPVKEAIPGIGGERMHGITLGEEGFSFSVPTTKKGETISFKDNGDIYTVKRLYLTDDGEMAIIGNVKIKDDLTEDRKEYESFAIGSGDASKANIFGGVVRQFVNPNTKRDFKNQKELLDHLKQLVGMKKQDTQEVSVEEEVTVEEQQADVKTKPSIVKSASEVPTGSGYLTTSEIKKMTLKERKGLSVDEYINEAFKAGHYVIE